jgi:hypothetical protein
MCLILSYDPGRLESIKNAATQLENGNYIFYKLLRREKSGSREFLSPFQGTPWLPGLNISNRPKDDARLRGLEIRYGECTYGFHAFVCQDDAEENLMAGDEIIEIEVKPEDVVHWGWWSVSSHDAVVVSECTWSGKSYVPEKKEE